jgi:hypothetical protein
MSVFLNFFSATPIINRADFLKKYMGQKMGRKINKGNNSSARDREVKRGFRE